jgi:hypothetical protein
VALSINTVKPRLKARPASAAVGENETSNSHVSELLRQLTSVTEKRPAEKLPPGSHCSVFDNAVEAVAATSIVSVEPGETMPKLRGFDWLYVTVLMTVA